MRRSLVLVVLVVALAGCGGGGGNVPEGPSSDPVAAVNGFINAMKAGAFDKMDKLVCTSKHDQILGFLSGGSTDMQELLKATTFEFKDLKVEQKSLTGDTAVVHVSGTADTKMDPAKGRDVVRRILAASAASGTQVSDQQVDQVITTFTQSRALDDDVDVTKENGGWVMCSVLGSETS